MRITDATAAAVAIRDKTAATSNPELSDEEITRLVAIALRPDGSYDANRAAAEGWRWKAGKVASAFNITIDGGAINRGDLLGHCLKMVEQYTGRASGVRSVRLGSVSDRQLLGGL